MTARFLKFAAQTDYNEWAITNIINELQVQESFLASRKGRAPAVGCHGSFKSYHDTPPQEAGIGYRMRYYAPA